MLQKGHRNSCHWACKRNRLLNLPTENKFSKPKNPRLAHSRGGYVLNDIHKTTSLKVKKNDNGYFVTSKFSFITELYIGSNIRHNCCTKKLDPLNTAMTSDVWLYFWKLSHWFILWGLPKILWTVKRYNFCFNVSHYCFSNNAKWL